MNRAVTLRRLSVDELFDPAVVRPGEDFLSSSQIVRALDHIELKILPAPTHGERLEEIVTRVNPDWCEQFNGDLAAAAEYCRRFEPAAWIQAGKEIAL